MKFKRNVNESELKASIFYNANCDTNFINKDVFNVKKDYFREMARELSDVNGTGLYQGLLVGYRKIDYRESYLYNLKCNDNKNLKDEELFKAIPSKDIRVPLKVPDIKLYQLLFIRNPIRSDDKKSEILNTLRILEDREYGKYKDFFIFPHVIDFLYSQLRIHDEMNKENGLPYQSDRGSDNLLGKDPTVTVLVPEIIDNAYYNMSGQKYPFIGDKYAPYKTSLSQSVFYFKSRSSSKKNAEYYINTGYLDIVNYKFKNGISAKIFALKFFGKWFFNPFTFFEDNDVIDIIKTINNEELADLETKNILANTKLCYDEIIDDVRLSSVNQIPSLAVWKDDDDRFTEEAMEEEETGTVNNDFTQAFRRRSIISKQTFIDLIYTRFSNRIYDFYPHFNATMLKQLVDKKNKKNRFKKSSKFKPDNFSLTLDVRTNNNLFCNSDGYNPIDVFYRIIVKKVDLNNRLEEQSNHKANLKFVSEDEMGLIDPNTSKSEKNAGNVGWYMPYLHKKQHARFTNREEME